MSPTIAFNRSRGAALQWLLACSPALLLSACIVLDVQTPAKGRPIAPGADSGVVFGHVAFGDESHWIAPSNTPYADRDLGTFLFGPEIRVVLFALEPRRAAPYPPFTGDGLFCWTMSAGDYVLMAADEKDMKEGNPSYWPLAAVRVLPGTASCAGDLELRFFEHPEGWSPVYQEYVGGIVDRCVQRQGEVEKKYAPFGRPPGKLLMVDMTDVQFTDTALARTARQRLDAAANAR
jgi:hypothetical protein